MIPYIITYKDCTLVMIYLKIKKYYMIKVGVTVFLIDIFELVIQFGVYHVMPNYTSWLIAMGYDWVTNTHWHLYDIGTNMHLI